MTMKLQLDSVEGGFRRSRHSRITLSTAFTLILLSADRLSAVGYRMPNQDPEGIARGNAFAATADTPAAIYYNPAGITQFEGQQARYGLYVISANTTYKSPSGQKAHTDPMLQAVPQLYYVDSLKNLPISLGLGVYAPYGLSLDWGNSSSFRTLAEKGRLLYACVNPVVGWRVNPKLSIALGPTINYSQASLQRGIGLTSNDQFKFDGSGFGFGLSAGLLWQPCAQWSFGVNYRSPSPVDY